MTLLFLILLRPALQAAEGGSRNPLHWLALIVAFLLDVIIAHTTWALVAGWPRKGEWTISHTLERLCKTQGKRQQLFIELSKEINRHSPTGKHIKAVL